MKNVRAEDDAAPAAVMTIDVAHPPVSSAEAERLLDEILRRVTLSGRTRVIRVIHGYGSGGKGGTLKTAVRNWAFRRKEKFRLVVPGEAFSPFDPEVLTCMSESGLSPAGLGPADPGFTLIFIR